MKHIALSKENPELAASGTLPKMENLLQTKLQVVPIKRSGGLEAVDTNGKRVLQAVQMERVALNVTDEAAHESHLRASN